MRRSVHYPPTRRLVVVTRRLARRPRANANAMTIERASTSARASRAAVASARRDGARATRRARGAARGTAAAMDDGASFVPGNANMAERHEYGGGEEYSRCVRASMRRERGERRDGNVERATTRGLTDARALFRDDAQFRRVATAQGVFSGILRVRREIDCGGAR